MESFCCWEECLGREPVTFVAARRGRQQRLRACPAPSAQPGKMFPGIAVISPEAKLPFSPGMNHADVKCLCFRNPAEFTARPSLLLTCMCKSPEFFQYLAVSSCFLLQNRTAGLEDSKCTGQVLRKTKAAASSGGNILSLLPAVLDLILPAGIFRLEQSGAQPGAVGALSVLRAEGAGDGEGSAFPWQEQRTHRPL